MRFQCLVQVFVLRAVRKICTPERNRDILESNPTVCINEKRSVTAHLWTTVARSSEKERKGSRLKTVNFYFPIVWQKKKEKERGLASARTPASFNIFTETRERYRRILHDFSGLWRARSLAIARDVGSGLNARRAIGQRSTLTRVYRAASN